VIHFIDLVGDPTSGAISLVTELVAADRGRTLYPTFRLDGVRYYMFQLFRALDSCHSLGIMHHDVKPDNLLINHAEQKLRLIDWGLAEIYFLRQQYPTYVGTLRYRAPELTLNYRYYDYSVDMLWAAGVTFGEMLVRCPFFEGDNANDVLRNVSDLITSSRILEFTESYGIDVSDGFLCALSDREFPGWIDLMKTIKPEMNDSHAVDLFKRLLIVQPARRISAAEALAHPFFAPLREAR
jgi:casein kinase II subunit alpha